MGGAADPDVLDAEGASELGGLEFQKLSLPPHLLHPVWKQTTSKPGQDGAPLGRRFPRAVRRQALNHLCRITHVDRAEKDPLKGPDRVR